MLKIFQDLFDGSIHTATKCGDSLMVDNGTGTTYFKSGNLLVDTNTGNTMVQTGSHTWSGTDGGTMYFFGDDEL